ncbi:DUF1722 domain-containing protein [Myxococcota bacterium]|nr:DUF1722 domain-containing protein [Myxococcota bacterium]MBU1535194.1 DUF1722 domain-containing protein [Myxococcota bacterium]
MRIWDVHPGYLNRQSLLGEHRELHGMFSIIVNGKKGYSRHPETLRWAASPGALAMRHEFLVAEMTLRGYKHHSPLPGYPQPVTWPQTFIDPPAGQFSILGEKYRDREQGRIPLPKNAQQLFAQHKYSVMARDVALYKEIGHRVSTLGSGALPADLVVALTLLLRVEPTPGGIRNAVQHMWGYVSHLDPVGKGEPEGWSTGQLLAQTTRRVIMSAEPYLYASTALSELSVW